MTALLALASAVLIGGADFLGGFASRRAPSVVVAATVQLLGLVIGIPLAVLWGSEGLAARDVLLSLLSGLAVGVGFAFFYTAMGAGLISIVAPVTAVTGASVPVAVGLFRGERPGAVAMIGIALALLAVVVVSLAPDAASRIARRISVSRMLALALGAGISFGLFYVLLAGIDKDAGMWPVPLQRIASSLLLLSLVAATRVSMRSTAPGILRFALSVAMLEVVATVFLLLALQRGPLAIASVLASLYPVTTVLLAGFVLRERLSRLQLGGVALALVAVLLVSVG